jgi:hypothetical protein
MAPKPAPKAKPNIIYSGVAAASTNTVTTANAAFGSYTTKPIINPNPGPWHLNATPGPQPVRSVMDELDELRDTLDSLKVDFERLMIECRYFKAKCEILESQM